MKKIYFLLLVMYQFSCSSSKQGKVIQGKDGKIESARINAKCTPPQKSYAKEIEAKLKADMDSLNFTPNASFDATFNQKVIKLREYSSKGLDLDLLTFRICEMANNRGFTSEQTSLLIQKAIELWNTDNKTSFQQNQTIISTNQTGGITAGNVFIDNLQRTLNNSLASKMLLYLNTLSFDSIAVSSMLGDTESFVFANEIASFIKNSFKNKKIEDGIQESYTTPILGLLIDTTLLLKQKTIRIIVGSKPLTKM